LCECAGSQILIEQSSCIQQSSSVKQCFGWPFTLQCKFTPLQAHRTLIVEVICSGYLCLGIPEKWTIIDSIYFAIVTVTTVGYGDLFPTTDIGKLFCIFWVPVGVAWVCGALINVSAAVLQLQQRLQDKAEKMALSASLQSIDLALKSQTMRQASRASTFVMSAGAVKKQTTAADQVDSTESDQTQVDCNFKYLDK
jgi:hypothetical protein